MISPATVVLAHLSTFSPVWQVALFGAIGAVIGDLLLFIFLRDKVVSDIQKSIRPSVLHRLSKSFHFGFLKWLIPLSGALIIASPLPDELGLAMLGISRSNTKTIMIISLVMNFIGIYMIASIAKAIVA
jgi:membrane protein DedA with SNARE-associated domain